MLEDMMEIQKHKINWLLPLTGYMIAGYLFVAICTKRLAGRFGRVKRY
jgi:hypothetical protein